MFPVIFRHEKSQAGGRCLPREALFRYNFYTTRPRFLDRASHVGVLHTRRSVSNHFVHLVCRYLNDRQGAYRGDANVARRRCA